MNIKEGVKHLIPDKAYIKFLFKKHMGYKLDLKNPITFNEKLQWLKLYDRNPLYTTLVDKYLVKQYVADKIGKQYIIPTLGVWKQFDDIDFNSLPDSFVLKCTHDSGGIVIVKSKTEFDFNAAKNVLQNSLRKNFYYTGREWPYKGVKPRIIAEKYMVDESGTELKDYKVFNFNGEPKLIQVDFGRFSKHMRNLYSTEWDYIEGKIEYECDPNYIIDKPKALKQMLVLSKKLSSDFPHLRVDFYLIDEKVYFGELTLYHGSGFEKFTPESLGLELGSYIKLPRS